MIRILLFIIGFVCFMTARHSFLKRVKVEWFHPFLFKQLNGKEKLLVLVSILTLLLMLMRIL